jgi:hypothetical protein
MTGLSGGRIYVESSGRPGEGMNSHCDLPREIYTHGAECIFWNKFSFRYIISIGPSV